MKTPQIILSSLASLGFACMCLISPGSALAAPDVSLPVTPSPQTAPVAPSLPYGVTEVVKMYQGGINKEVILGYIQSTALPFHLTADGIIYLNHIGVPQDVISALIHRDGQLHDQAALAYQQQSQNFQQQQNYQQQPMNNAPGTESNPQVLANVGNPVVSPTTPPPPVYGDGITSYPDYSVYPYDYGSYYWPPVVVGGWGWGRGWGGWGHGGFAPGFGHFGGDFGHGGFSHGGFGGGFHGGGGGGFGGHGGGGFSGHGGGGHGGGHR